MTLNEFLKMVTVYANDLETLGMFQPGCIFQNNTYYDGDVSYFLVLLEKVIPFFIIYPGKLSRIFT